MLVLPRSGFRYASFAGPIPGGLTAGTLLLVIVTASGTALAAGSALEGVIQEQRPDALILLTLLAGLIMVGLRSSTSVGISGSSRTGFGHYFVWWEVMGHDR